MGKTNRKVTTEGKYIDRAEEKLGIKYPDILREKLKKNNGFYWGFYKFYCVLDDEDKYHTYDDVVRENDEEYGGWSEFLPKGHVAIADEDSWCLTLNKEQDGKIYLYHEGELDVFAESESELETKLNARENEEDY